VAVLIALIIDPALALAIAAVSILIATSVTLYRLIRGHSFKCSLYWGLAGIFRFIGSIVMYSF
jgi:hypothetical protein